MRSDKRFLFPFMMTIAACGFAMNAAILAKRNSPVSCISLGLAAALLLGARWLSAKERGGRNSSV